MKQECKTAVEEVLGRKLTDKEAELLETEFKKASKEVPAEDIKKWKSMSDEERAEAIADRAMQNYTQQHLKEISNLVNDTEIQANLWTELTSHPTLTPLQVLSRKLTHHTDQYGVQSVEQSIKAIESRYLAQMADVLNSTQKSFGFMVDANTVKLIVKEIFGEDTGKPEIKALAKQFSDTFEDMRTNFNRYGGDIKKIDHYIPQSHSHYKVVAKTPEQWVDFVFPLLDRSKYKDWETRRALNDEEVKQLLTNVYSTIASEGNNKKHVQDRNVLTSDELAPGLNMQNLHLEHREIHFKDSNAWLEYQETFGEVNFLDLLTNHIRRYSTELGLMQQFGSNPEKMVKNLNHVSYNQLMQDPKHFKEHGKLKKNYERNNRFYDLLAGRTLNIDSTLANVGSGIRALNVSSKMGSAAFYAVSDQASIKLTAEMNNVAFTDIFGKELQAMFNKQDREFAISAGLGVQEMVSSLGRWGDDDLASAATKSQKFKTTSQKLANLTIRMSGLNHATASAKRGFGAGLMKHITAINEKSDWTSLGSKDKEALKRGGITEQVWNGLKLVERTTSPRGDKIITNEGFFKMSDDDILNHYKFNREGYSAEQLANEAYKLKEKLANAYMNHIYSQTDLGIVGIGAREQEFMDFAFTKGTVGNELTRFFWQYKQFIVGSLMRHLNRGLSEPTTNGKVGYLVKFAVYMTLAGGVIAQLQQLSQGKDLLDMTDPTFYMTSLVKGGGAPLLGDALNGAFGSERQLIDFFTPAAFKDPIDIATWATKQGKKALNDEDTNVANAGLDKVQKNIPLQNLWYARTAIDRLVWAELHNAIDPDYRFKRQRRMERMGTSTFYWDLDNENIRMPEMTDQD